MQLGQQRFGAVTHYLAHSAVGQRLRRWWRTWYQPMIPTVRQIYEQMLTQLQLNMLVLLLAVGLPLSLIFGLQLAQGQWSDLKTPQILFGIHVGRVVALVACVWYFLWRKRVRAAWVATIIVTQGTLLLQILVMREPGLLVFGLFSLAGPAIAFPLQITLAMIACMAASVTLIVQWGMPGTTTAWVSIILLFATLMLGFAAIGAAVRHFVRHFAIVMHEQREAAARQAQLQQQTTDLAAQVEQLTSLEHDLRQPVRAVQGYLALLLALNPDTRHITQPAIAAASRAERLVNNMLDQSRADAQHALLVRRSVDLAALFAQVQTTLPGLAQYYTDPPVRIRFLVPALPTAWVDSAQLERALLNLLDNALTHSPPHGEIVVQVSLDAELLHIRVRDQGPGIPAEVLRRLQDGQACPSSAQPRMGFGLRQVKNMVAMHGGTLLFEASKHGSAVHIALPLGSQ
jgi:signal transduction histidine kinase